MILLFDIFQHSQLVQVCNGIFTWSDAKRITTYFWWHCYALATLFIKAYQEDRNDKGQRHFDCYITAVSSLRVVKLQTELFQAACAI